MKIRKLIRLKKFRSWISLQIELSRLISNLSLKQALVNERIDRETDLMNSTDKPFFINIIAN